MTSETDGSIDDRGCVCVCERTEKKFSETHRNCNEITGGKRPFGGETCVGDGGNRVVASRVIISVFVRGDRYIAYGRTWFARPVYRRREFHVAQRR